MTTVDRIIDTMQRKGISQVELSKATGMTTSTVNYVFLTSKKINADYLLPISKLLGVSIEWLVTGIDPDNYFPTEVVLSEDETELLDIFRSVDREGRIAILYSAYSQRNRIRESHRQESGTVTA